MLTCRALLLSVAYGVLGTAAWAEIVIVDGYARSSRPSAPTGAAFMVIENTSDTDDRLIAATSPVAERVELHTHISDGDGVMRMREIEGGIPIPGGSSHALERGGDHVMLMGLTESLEDGGSVPMTLTFEKAGAITVDVPVDLSR